MAVSGRLCSFHHPNVLVVFKARQQLPCSPALPDRGRWPAGCPPPTTHLRSFPWVAFVGSVCQQVRSCTESAPQEGSGLCPDLRSSRICSGWEQNMGNEDRPPRLLLYTEGFLQIEHITYWQTHETQAIPWSTHPKTSSRNLKGFFHLCG